MTIKCEGASVLRMIVSNDESTKAALQLLPDCWHDLGSAAVRHHEGHVLTMLAVQQMYFLMIMTTMMKMTKTRVGVNEMTAGL